MSIFKPCLKGTWCRILPSPTLSQGQNSWISMEWRLCKSSSTVLAALGISALHHVDRSLTFTQNQESKLFLITCWHLLSLELLRLVYKTGHLSLRLLLQSCFASGTVHFSSGCATPRQVLHCRANSSSASTNQLSGKLFQYNAVHTPTI